MNEFSSVRILQSINRICSGKAAFTYTLLKSAARENMRFHDLTRAQCSLVYLDIFSAETVTHPGWLL